MHSRNIHYNNNNMTTYNNNANANNTVKTVANVLNPLYEEQYQHHDNNNNSMMCATMNNNNNNLRAASHVSFEHTEWQHEYSPKCQCNDCQALVNHYTQYEILDAYVTDHLAYESSLQANYGFVPCIGGPFGHIAFRKVMVDVYDQTTGEVIGQREQQQPVPSNSYIFHMHLHEMSAVPADIKERSYQRFLAAHSANNNNNAVAVAPSTPMNNNNTAAAPVAIPTPNSQRRFNNNNNNGNNHQTFSTHQNVVSTTNSAAPYHRNFNNKARVNYNNNNGYNHQYAQQQQQQQFYYNNNNNGGLQYTQQDVEQAVNATHYTEAARLGY